MHRNQGQGHRSVVSTQGRADSGQGQCQGGGLENCRMGGHGQQAMIRVSKKTSMVRMVRDRERVRSRRHSWYQSRVWSQGRVRDEVWLD